MPDPKTPYLDLFTTFATMLDAAGGNAAVASSLADTLPLVRGTPGIDAGQPVWLSAQVVEAFPDLTKVLEEGGVSGRLADDPATTRDAPIGITATRLAIAETGSVLLHEDDLPGRSVSLMTQRLIVLCRIEALVPSLDEAAPVLQEIARGGPSYVTFVTGPSRTADIERELAVGVQGPGVLYVVFLAHLAS